MKRKSLIVSIIVAIIFLFSIPYTFAANNTLDNMADGIRNMVGSAENTVEGAGNAAGRTIENGMHAIGNGSEKVENATENTVGAITNNGDNGYTATRTTARTTTDGMANVSTTTYTWVIIGITAVAIVVLLWSYFTRNKDNNIYIDSNDR